ncbi:nitroreductase family protein [Sphingomonas sp. FW199]|uniref:nitroreductase family protein n=1 Tax=Sphingomonas sp. FW199 TaxID=3400217 RepID=UPI003CF560C0
MSGSDVRTPAYPVDALFTDRWSPRAFDGSALAPDLLMTLFEAARWAPSAYNGQPWRFIYALRDTPAWSLLLDTLIPFNQGWASSASALIYIVSDGWTRDADGTATSPSYSHSFDTGAAWAQLALQAVRSGLFAHGMTGFDEARARGALQLPDEYRIEAAAAIGRIGDPSDLPEGLRSRELPSSRKPLSDLVYRDAFGRSA